MEHLNQLRQANPQIAIYTTGDPEFKAYGRVIREDTQAFCAAAQTIPFPEEGSRYQAAVPVLEELPAAAELIRTHCGELDLQLGLCWGHSNQLNALEWHTCNELNIAVRELVLLLAKRSDLDSDGSLDAGKIKAFYLAPGEMVEIYADTLHFCPCEVTTCGFSCIVGLQRGTNLPLDGERQPGQQLWAKNKWLIAHRENTGLLQRGACAGIYGENWRINPVTCAE